MLAAHQRRLLKASETRCMAADAFKASSGVW
jgi:hypothetical protein